MDLGMCGRTDLRTYERTDLRIDGRFCRDARTHQIMANQIAYIIRFYPRSQHMCKTCPFLLSGTFAIKEYDCCGCRVIKCFPCAPPMTKEKRCPARGLPLSCYDYDPKGAFREGTLCIESTCRYNPPPAPINEVHSRSKIWYSFVMSG